MLKEIVEDALARGERLKKDIVGQILSSVAFGDLVNSKKFADTVARVIQTKDEISKTLHRKIADTLKVMSIPSREQIETYEKRVRQLEGQIDRLGRRIMSKKLTNSHKRNSHRKK